LPFYSISNYCVDDGAEPLDDIKKYVIFEDPPPTNITPNLVAAELGYVPLSKSKYLTNDVCGLSFSAPVPGLSENKTYSPAVDPPSTFVIVLGSKKPLDDGNTIITPRLLWLRFSMSGTVREPLKIEPLATNVFVSPNPLYAVLVNVEDPISPPVRLANG
jgi:hypothetical protein